MNSVRRVQPPKMAEEYSERLIDNGPFESKQKLLMFAAALGHRRGVREPLQNTGEGIRWAIFQRNGDDSFITALAVAETQSLDIFDERNLDGAITIFEEYANGGLNILDRKIIQKAGADLDQIVSLIVSAREEKDSSELEGIDDSTLTDLGI